MQAKKIPDIRYVGCKIKIKKEIPKSSPSFLPWFLKVLVCGRVFAFRTPHIKSHKKDFVVHYAGWMTHSSILQSPEER